jgi:hypothetical protein
MPAVGVDCKAAARRCWCAAAFDPSDDSPAPQRAGLLPHEESATTHDTQRGALRICLIQAQALAVALANLALGFLLACAVLWLTGAPGSVEGNRDAAALVPGSPRLSAAAAGASPAAWPCLLAALLPVCLPALVAYLIHPPVLGIGQARLLGGASAAGVAAVAAALQLPGGFRLLAGLLSGEPCSTAGSTLIIIISLITAATAHGILMPAPTAPTNSWRGWRVHCCRCCAAGCLGLLLPAVACRPQGLRHQPQALAAGLVRLPHAARKQPVAGQQVRVLAGAGGAVDAKSRLHRQEWLAMPPAAGALPPTRPPGSS